MSFPLHIALARLVLTATVALAACYVIVLALAWLMQEWFIFPTAVASRSQRSGPPPPGVEQVWLTIDESNPAGRVECWFVPGAGRSAESPGPAVIFFHGNADLIDRAVDIAPLYTRRGVSVLLPEYRGYGRSSGRPSQQAITRDMVRIRDWLDRRPEVDPRRVVYHGQSLGCGVAAALADERPPAAFILQSSFTSVAAMMRRYGVPAFLARNPFRVDETVKRLGLPVLIIHGRWDMIIPVSHGRTLHRVLPNSRYLELPDGHNDLPSDPRPYIQAIHTFLEDCRLIDAR